MHFAARWRIGLAIGKAMLMAIPQPLSKLQRQARKESPGRQASNQRVSVPGQTGKTVVLVATVP